MLSGLRVGNASGRTGLVVLLLLTFSWAMQAATTVNSTLSLRSLVDVLDSESSLALWYRADVHVEDAVRVDLRFSHDGIQASPSLTGLRVDAGDADVQLTVAREHGGEWDGSDNRVTSITDYVGILPVPAPRGGDLIRLTYQRPESTWVAQSVSQSGTGWDGLYLRANREIGAGKIGMTIRTHAGADGAPYTIGTFGVVPLSHYMVHAGIGVSRAQADEGNAAATLYVWGDPSPQLAVQAWLSHEQQNFGNRQRIWLEGTFAQRVRASFERFHPVTDPTYTNVSWQLEYRHSLLNAAFHDQVRSEVYPNNAGLGAKLVMSQVRRGASDQPTSTTELAVTSPLWVGRLWGLSSWRYTRDDDGLHHDGFMVANTQLEYDLRLFGRVHPRLDVEGRLARDWYPDARFVTDESLGVNNGTAALHVTAHYHVNSRLRVSSAYSLSSELFLSGISVTRGAELAVAYRRDDRTDFLVTARREQDAVRSEPEQFTVTTEVRVTF